MENDELSVMKAIQDLLEPLSNDVQARVLHWSVARFGVSKQSPSLSVEGAGLPQNATESGGQADITYEDFADFFDAAGPKSQKMCVLVGGYWLQFQKDESPFSSQAVNSALKDLGHGASNVTDCFYKLIALKPALAMQVKKSGTSKQSRKHYKLTQAGKKEVEKMIGQKAEENQDDED